MKHFLFKKDDQSEQILKDLKDIFNMTHTEAIRQGLILIYKQRSTELNELGKAYQAALIRMKKQNGN